MAHQDLLALRTTQYACFAMLMWGPPTPPAAADEATRLQYLRVKFGEVIQPQHAIEVLHELDTAARIAKGVDANISIEGGKVMSLGDGTVPHWSLRHAETFQETCSVSLEEIDGAEHREILADSRFHKILIEHITSAE